MAIEFTLDPDQSRLRAAAREIAHDVLAGVSARTAGLASPEERFAATRPAYQELVEAGYLRKILPESAGGELRSTLDLALIAEELTAVDASVALTLFAVTLGLAPVVHAGTAAQQRAHLARFLVPAGTPLAAFALSEPGGSANFDAPPPAEGVRTTAVRDAGDWVITGAKKWVSNSAGWEGTGPDRSGRRREHGPVGAPRSRSGQRADRHRYPGHDRAPGALDADDHPHRRAGARRQRRRWCRGRVADRGVRLRPGCRPGRCVRARPDARRVRPRAAVRPGQQTRRPGADHRLPGRRLRAGQREDPDGSGPIADLAGLLRARHRLPRRPRARAARQGLRLRDGGRGHHRPDAGRGRRQLRSRAAARAAVAGRPGAAIVRRQQPGPAPAAAARHAARPRLRRGRHRVRHPRRSTPACHPCSPSRTGG